MATTRVTVTLPSELVAEVDRLEKNRSRFVLEGVRREVQRRKREELRRSLAGPHPESLEMTDEGLIAWLEGLPEEEEADLLDVSAGTAVRWREGEGWTPAEE